MPTRPVRLPELRDSKAVAGRLRIPLLIAALLCAVPALAQPLSITTTSPLAAGTAGVAYGPFAFTATGGTPPYSWALTSGTLPPQMTFNNGILAGTATTAGNIAFTVSVTDSAGSPASAQGEFVLPIAPRITTTSLRTWSINRPYPATTLTASGTGGALSWFATGLPPGLTVSSAGVLSGTATSAGTFSVVLNVVDPSETVGTVTLPLTINPAPVINDSSPLPSGYRVTPYSYQFGSSLPVTPGTAPYTWTNLNPLPGGLTLSSSGLLSGTPTNTGLFTFTIQVTDTAGATGSKTFAMVVATLPVVVTVLTAPPATTVGVPYPPPGAPPQPYFSASAGTGVYTWTATNLPPGIGIDSVSAALSGTPTQAGLFTASVRATDPLNGTDAKPVNILINPTPVISVTPLQPCTAGTLCTRSLVVTGGTGAFTWLVTSGTPPAGMTVASNGSLSGIPAAVATPTQVSFTVRATDSVGASDTKTVSIIIEPAIVISPASLPAVTSGLAYSQSLSASGGTGSITWSGTGLPAWLGISGAGVLSGTAPVVGSATVFNFSVGATDSINASATRAYSVTVNPLPAILTSSPLPAWTAGQPYSTSLTASGGTGALQFSDAGATLPAWLSLSAGGVLTGTPPAAGPYGFTARVTDSLGASTTKAFTLTINPIPSVTTTSLPATTSGIAYSQPLTNTDGTGTFTWSGSGLPAWLTINGAVLSGTAPVVASATAFSFSVSVTDSTGAVSQPRPLSVTVNPPVLITTTSPLPSTSAGVSYSQTFAATGGTGTLGWSVTNRPAWLTQNGATLSGVAPSVNVATNFTFSMTATDTVGAFNTQQFTITVNPGITITTASALGPWTETRPFTATLAAVGGVPAYTFTDAGATLPQWLSISPQGVVSGTPPAAGSYGFTARVTDSASATTTKQFTLTVNAVPTVNPAPLPATTSGIVYTRTLAVNNGTPSFTWAAQNLPSWLALTGPSLSGTAPVVAAATVYNFSVTVTDAAGAVSVPQAFSVTVNPPVQITTTSPLPSTTSGANYSQTFAATGGTGTLGWSITNRPAWLTLNGATLSGVAPSVNVATNYTFSMTATDTVGALDTRQFTITVNSGITITTASALGPWTENRPFTVTLAAAGGTPAYTFSDAGATLPAWLTISPQGVVSGTPPAAGSYGFTARVTDSLSATTTKQFTLSVKAAPTVNPTPLPATTSGRPYNQTLSVNNGTPSFTWTAQNLPAWLTLTGPNLTGTAPTVATATVYNFTVSVTDAAGAVSVQQALSVTVNPPVLITTTSPLPAATSGASYSQTFSATGGTGALAWSITNRPAWLTLNGATLSGTAPTVATATTFTFSMTATDTVGAFNTQQFSITVNNGINITNPSALGQWTVGKLFTVTFAAAGGTPAYQFTDAGATLPAWLALSTSGVLSGTPPATGTFSFTVKVTDSLGATAQKQFSLIINASPTITTTSLPATTSGIVYNRSLTAVNGTAPLNWSGVNLPFWLTLGGSFLNGTAPLVTVPTAYTFTITATDAAGAVTPPQSLSVTVNPPVQITTATPLPSANSGASYSQTFNSTGGTGAISWSSSDKPAWLVLSGATLSGVAPTVTASTNYNFSMTATDSVGALDTRPFTITVSSGIVITTASTLGPWTATRPFTATLAAAGGTTPYQFSDAGATLPQWLTLSANGALSGTPPTAGNFGFTAKVTDNLGASTTKPFSLTVNPVPAVGGATLPAITSGLVFNQSLTQTGGTPPFNWSAANLPGWLTLNGPALSGTAPVVAAPTDFSFSVTVTDGPGAASAAQSLTVTVNPPVTIVTTSLTDAIPGVPYSASLSATGGTGALSWSSSNLPAWLTLNGPTLSGTPPLVASGTTVSITVRATDTLGAFASKTFQLIIGSAGPAIFTASPLPSWTVTRPYSAGLTAIGGQSPYSNWTVSSGSLPDGLQLDAATGLIHGTPTSAGTSNFTIQFTDAASATGSKAFGLTINPLPHITTLNLPSASLGTSYQQSLASTGGTTPLTWSTTGLAGTGLSLTAGGVVTGTPTAATPASINFTAILTDAAGATDQASLSIAIGSTILFSTPASLPATTSLRQYSVAIAATGGTGALTFSVTTGSSLPSWLSLTPQGVLSGQAPLVSTTTSYTFSITATDTVGITASKNFNFKVNPLPYVVTSSLPAGTVGAIYSATLHGAAGTGALTFSATGLPGWLALNSATGTLSGTPPQAGPVSFSVIATDSVGAASAPAQFTITVNPAGGTPYINPVCPFPVTTEGLPFAANLTANGGFPPYNWSTTGLPAWMSLTPSSGAITGTAVGGIYSFTLRANDSQGQTVSQPCGISVNPAPQVTTTTLAPGTAGAPYWQTLSAFGGTGALTWTSSNLPAWLTLDPATGVLSGTPSISGSATFSVQVTDTLGAVSPGASLSLVITSPGGVPVIQACPLPSLTAGAPFSFPLTAALGAPPYSWAVSGLPGGVGSAGAVVSGIPTSPGAFTLHMTVTDASNQSASASCDIDVLPALVVITQSLPDATVGSPYSQVLSASGGHAPLRWSAVSLPSWLTLDPVSGELAGTPTTTGAVSFSVQVTDSFGLSSPAVPQNLHVLLAGGQLLISTSCPLPDSTEGLLISAIFSARQGTPPYTWSASGLPSGLVMTPAGQVAGIVPPGLVSFNVQVTDVRQQVAATGCSVKINPKPLITTTSLPDGSTGSTYSASLVATGGTGRLLWGASALLPGISLNGNSGALSGTPSAPGSATVSVRVTDILGVSAGKSFSVAITSNPNPTTPVLSSSCPSPATAGVGYTYTVQAAGGAPPYRYFIANLPSGLNFDPASGSLGGTPVAGGSTQILIQVIDSQSHNSVATCSLSVTGAAPLRSLTAVTPGGRVGVAYSGSLSVNGGVPPYRWSLQSGTLPPGITLDPSGALGGTPTAAGSFTFTARVTDAGGTTANLSATIDVAASLNISTPPALPDGLGGSTYSQTLAASGATGAITWSLRSGALPDGLTLDPATGTISGTPTRAGSFTFTVRAVDASLQTVDAVFTIVIRLSALPQVTISGLPATIDPNQQLRIGISLSAGYPLDITGTLTLALTPDSTIGFADPQAVFTSGSRSITFRIPANATQAVFDAVPLLQTGTLAEGFRLDATFQSGGATVTPPAPATAAGQLPRLVPVIVGTPAVVRSASGIQISLNAFSTTRQVTSAVFHFGGTNLQGSDLTVTLQDLVGAWYANPQSQAVGSQFSYSQTFNVQGNSSQVTSVSVTLTNAIGSSQTVTVSF